MGVAEALALSMVIAFGKVFPALVIVNGPALPSPVKVHKLDPLSVIPEINVKLPKTDADALMDNAGVLSMPVKLMAFPRRGISAVIVRLPAVTLLASNTTASWQSGTDAPPAPLLVADHMAVDDHEPLEVFPTQYRVVAVVKVIPVLPPALPEPPVIPERFHEPAPAPVMFAKSAFETVTVAAVIVCRTVPG